MGNLKVVSYDLNSPGQAYDLVKGEIEKYDHKKILKSAYLVCTTKSCQAIVDGLLKCIDKNDRFFVNDFDDYQGYLSPDVWEWIKQKKNSSTYSYR